MVDGEEGLVLFGRKEDVAEEDDDEGGGFEEVEDKNRLKDDFPRPITTVFRERVNNDCNRG